MPHPCCLPTHPLSNATTQLASIVFAGLGGWAVWDVECFCFILVYIRAAKMLVYGYNARFIFMAGRRDGVLDPSWVDMPRFSLGGQLS